MLKALVLATLIQGNCFPEAHVTKQLFDKYHEAPIVTGTLTDGSEIRIYSAPNGDTFTITVILPTGLACLVATGRDLHPLKGQDDRFNESY